MSLINATLPGAPLMKSPAGLMKYLGLALALTLAASTPLWVQSQYWLYLVTSAVIYALIATGVNITNGYLGILNLAVAGQIGLGGYACALLVMNGVPAPIALIVSAATGFFISALIFTVFARLDGFFFGLSTLAASEIIRLLLRNLEDITNGVRGLRGYPNLTNSAAASFWVALTTLAVVAASLYVSMRSPIGLVWRSIRENPMKAAAAGINIQTHKLLGYSVSGAVIALGGAYLALLMQYIDPTIAELKMLVQIILMVALGGPGTISGPLFGAFVITLVPEILRVANEWRLIAYGVTLIAIVLMLPQGIVGALQQYTRLRRGRTRRTG